MAGHDVVQSNVSVFLWWGWGKRRKQSLSMAGLGVINRTLGVPDKNQEWQTSSDWQSFYVRAASLNSDRQWRTWLKHVTTSRNVAGLIPLGVRGSILFTLSFRPHYGPGVGTAEMSTRDILRFPFRALLFDFYGFNKQTHTFVIVSTIIIAFWKTLNSYTFRTLPVHHQSLH